MPSAQHVWSSSSQSSLGVRLGAVAIVVALHVLVIAGIYSVRQPQPQLSPETEPIMVSVVQAPEPQVAKADPTPQPQPQPPVEQPPPPPPDPQPEPQPDVKPDPEPPPPIVEHPVAPKPKPKPKPRPQPQPQPQQPVPPKPVDTPPPPPPATPAGTPDGATAQAPQQGAPKDQPELVSHIEYAGAGPQAVYPYASKRLREEGHVMVLVVVDTQGQVAKLTVVTSSGYPRLDEAALEAVRRVHFKPYTRNGVAYSAQVRIPFEFNMRN